jgi:hypothetical protein
MSNARIRRHLEGVSAPLIAWLIDNYYVADDCGILNSVNLHLREGLIVGSRMLQGQVPAPMPAPRERL